MWRCVSRLDYGTKYCHNSPTLDEELLQRAILAAINSVMSQKSTLIRQITSAMEMELAPVPGESMSLADIERRLGELNDPTRELVAESARAEDATACTAQLRACLLYTSNGNIVYLAHPAVWYTAEGGISALDIMLQDLESELLG